MVSPLEALSGRRLNGGVGISVKQKENEPMVTEKSKQAATLKAATVEKYELPVEEQVTEILRAVFEQLKEQLQRPTLPQIVMYITLLLI